jgi:5-formyltetrahydrofolate cyclo-ligase
MPDFSVDAEESRADKISLRNRLLAQRREMGLAAALTAAVPVQATLVELIRTRLPSTVTAYVPVGPEPGGPDLPAVLADALRPHGGRLLLPVLLNDNDLDWSAYAGDLVPGPRGLSEPPGARLGPGAITGADLVVVPALAVDPAGRRLGRGGGSYDRALARLTPGRTFVVALLHDGELVGAVPAEPHDHPVDATITPSAGLTLSERATDLR